MHREQLQQLFICALIISFEFVIASKK